MELRLLKRKDGNHWESPYILQYRNIYQDHRSGKTAYSEWKDVPLVEEDIPSNNTESKDNG